MLSMTRSRATLSLMSYLFLVSVQFLVSVPSMQQSLVLEDHGRERGAGRRSRGRDQVAVACLDQPALGRGLIVDEGVRAEAMADRRDVVEQHLPHRVVQQPA